MSFVPTQLLPDGNVDPSVIVHRLRNERWIPILQHACDFGPEIFGQISINLIRNPNINSTHLFRADILYDSHDNEYTNVDSPAADIEQLLQEYALDESLYNGFKIERTLMRLMVPRNPQLDKPIAQTCLILRSSGHTGMRQCLIVYIPHVTQVETLPWYHPAVQYLAYLHTWPPNSETSDSQNPPDGASKSDLSPGVISIHFQLFPSQTFPLPPRLLRTAHHLLSTLYKHGQGNLAGYTKRVHHDQLISQQRVQGTYAELKRKHAKRLCDVWVEQTEPSKHVFEDLGIAAFLVELWKDMYRPFNSSDNSDRRPEFPGFADIGCGNGVLTEILLLSGYQGWGFDIRRRKTWAVLSKQTQAALHELILVPSPLFDLHTPPAQPISALSRALSALFPLATSSLQPPSQPWHNGIFPTGTFIVSNHADELTSWTPLLASLSCSPFLAIPCCSHNLSGMRFRAPSVFNSQMADTHAPSFFAKNITKSKSVPISIAAHIGTESGGEGDEAEDPNSEFAKFLAASDSLSISEPPVTDATTSLPTPPTADSIPQPPRTPPKVSPNPSPDRTTTRPPSSGDLHALAPSARAKQPSAYSSLCDWVAHLATEVGYVVEKEVLRIPSTRNVGIIGRSWVGGDERAVAEAEDGAGSGEYASEAGKGVVEGASGVDGGGKGEKGRGSDAERYRKVIEIARREGADGRVWMQRAVGLSKGGGNAEHVEHR